MNRRRFYLLVVLVLAVGGAAAWFMRPETMPVTYLPTPAMGGSFTLQDEDGKPITDKAFRGKAMLIFFGYTFCPDICPTSLSLVAETMNILGPDAEKVVPIFISVDPKRDTPAHLKEYVKKFDPRIRGLSGTPSQVAEAARLYKVIYNRAEGANEQDYLIDHSALLYVMRPDGRFYTFFSHGTPAEEMARQIREMQ